VSLRRTTPETAPGAVLVVVRKLRIVGDYGAGETFEAALGDAEGLVERGMVDPADAAAKNVLRNAVKRRDTAEASPTPADAGALAPGKEAEAG